MTVISDGSFDAGMSGAMVPAFRPQDFQGSRGLVLQIQESHDRTIRSIARENSVTLDGPVVFTLPGIADS